MWRGGGGGRGLHFCEEREGGGGACVLRRGNRAQRICEISL